MAFPVDREEIVARSNQSRTRSLYDRAPNDIYLIPHHAFAYTVDQIVATFRDPARNVNAQFAIGPRRAGSEDYEVWRTTPERLRAHTTASSLDDKAVTYEMANLSLSWPYPVAERGLWILANLIVYMHREYGMNMDRRQVLSHREVYLRGFGSYPTQCPGDHMQSRLDWAVAVAIQIEAGTLPVDDKGKPVLPPLPEIEEEEMRPRFGHRKDSGNDEWMLVHPSFKHPTDEKQLGYLVTTDEKEARGWARAFKSGWSGNLAERYDFNLVREEYIELQNSARLPALSWRG